LTRDMTEENKKKCVEYAQEREAEAKQPRKAMSLERMCRLVEKDVNDIFEGCNWERVKWERYFSALRDIRTHKITQNGDEADAECVVKKTEKLVDRWKHKKEEQARQEQCMKRQTRIYQMLENELSEIFKSFNEVAFCLLFSQLKERTHEISSHCTDEDATYALRTARQILLDKLEEQCHAFESSLGELEGEPEHQAKVIATYQAVIDKKKNGDHLVKKNCQISSLLGMLERTLPIQEQIIKKLEHVIDTKVRSFQ